jgi:hypothetical protein
VIETNTVGPFLAGQHALKQVDHDAEVRLMVAIAGFPAETAEVLISRQLSVMEVYRLLRNALSRPPA